MLKRWRGSLSARLDNVSLLTAIQFLMFMGMGTTGPSLSIYLRELGASFSRISAVLTTSSLVSLGANYAFGRWSDHLGRRKPIVLGALAVLTVGWPCCPGPNPSSKSGPSWSWTTLPLPPT